MLSDENLLAGGYEHRSSIRTLAMSLDTPFTEILRGQGSLGGIMQRYGYWSVPSPAYPYPVDLPYYNGNYDLERHGSKRGGTISGTQIEAPYGRLLKIDRQRFVRSLTRAIVTFVEATYGFSLVDGSQVGICTRFNDVPYAHWAREPIERIAGAGYIAGCLDDTPSYCPDAALSRLDLAMLLERSLHGADYVPDQSHPQVFVDISPKSPEANWIGAAWRDGLIRPCISQPFSYCSDDPTTRAEAAFGLLRLMHGDGFVPPQAVGLFEDVPAYGREARWVEAAFTEGLLRPCGTSPQLIFCPNAALTRAEAAVTVSEVLGTADPPE
jgi:hypothetical protein